ncbi:F-box domain-containing protein [Mycena indigotica]|uniref:F-box domain-containing protein n=1 Tax=Mycena indigotica TaxID=2126181 RepID=A0A8H6S3N2_9AGAR|nr:F-box domain-containing protein [Mycena indigotica]KAF7291446.1 F-box domain-containing protein [Mycena indigotica]
MAEPQPKRKRSDSEDAVDLHAVSIHEAKPIIRSEVWFDDGNIVIEAQRTQFRVFRSQLALHSPKFKALMDPLTPAAILVVSDNPVDLNYVFKRLLYHRYPENEPLPLPVIQAFARIGKKYEITWLFENAVQRLTTAYPSTLDKWTSSTGVEACIMPDPDCHSAVATTHKYALEVSILAREIDLPQLLPTTFWLLTAPRRLPQLVTPRAAALPEADRRAILEGLCKRMEVQRQTTAKWLRAKGHYECLTP